MHGDKLVSDNCVRMAAHESRRIDTLPGYIGGVIVNSRQTEYTGDDVPQKSALIFSLGPNCSDVSVPVADVFGDRKMRRGTELGPKGEAHGGSSGMASCTHREIEMSFEPYLVSRLEILESLRVGTNNCAVE